MYAEMLQVLLTLEQYRMAVPHTLACYVPYGTLISGEIAIELNKLENEGIEAFDTHLKEMVIVVAPLLCIVADS